MASSPFLATPLNPSRREIRLVQLLPGDSSSEIHCTHFVVSLDEYRAIEGQAGAESDRYDALSYTWGSVDGQCSVTIGGSFSLFVSQNLDAALRRLRLRQNSRMIWVDQMSIDQSNLAERADQVRLMYTIYSRASRVIVWLGEARLSQVPVNNQKYEHAYAGDPGSVYGKSFNPEVLFTPEQDLEHRTLETVVKAAETQWSERSWVIQEFIAAASEPLIAFGEFTKPLQEVIQRGGLLDTVTFHPDNWQFDTTLSPTVRLRIRLLSLHDMRAETGRSDHGLTAMTIAKRGTLATEIRDHVYSILSLVNPNVSQQIQVDYLATPTSVWEDATFAEIAVSEDLYILSIIRPRFRDGFREDGTQVFEGPSWVVDFKFNRAIAAIDMSRPDPKTDELRWKSVFGDAPRSQYTHITRLDHKLQVSGLLIDEIQDVPLRMYGQYTIWPDHRSKLASHLQRLPLTNPYRAISQCVRQQSTSGTSVCCGRRLMDWSNFQELNQIESPYGQPDQNFIGFAFHHVFRLWHRCALPGVSGSLRRFDHGVWQGYTSASFHGTAFFTTKAGFIGIGWPTLAPGQVVALLDGAALPVILQARGEDYLFQGFAYVEGVMNGELSLLCDFAKFSSAARGVFSIC